MDTSDGQGTAGQNDLDPSPLPVNLLSRVFCLAVVLLAVWRFSENTADPDLWGHVIFGQRMLAAGAVERVEPFSWTAPGNTWINHEVGAELVMGAVHRCMGGTGLFLLMLATGLLTFAIALRAGAAGLAWPERAAAWGIAALTAREIAFGFAPRPQIFTCLFLAIMLLVLRKAHLKWKWAPLALPPLFLVWINTHGGALAGFCLLAAAAVATAVQSRLGKPGADQQAAGGRASVLPLWLGLAGSAAALFCNPWGYGLLSWLVGSVMWLRPEISEWNPPDFGVEHLPMFAMIPISAFALAFSRRGKWLWEAVVLALLGVAAIRLQRHIPLFCIAALMIVPPHLADAVRRFGDRVENLRLALASAAVQWALVILLLAGTLMLGVGILADNKEKFYTIEVPRYDYPVAATVFIRENGIRGNMLVSFDWGEYAIWELPDCAVSIDGRLDTCYPRDLIREHWNFYEGREVDKAILDPGRADFALLSMSDIGWMTLPARNQDWTLAYRDEISVVLVRDIKRFPRLQSMTLPLQAPPAVLAGREPFPDAVSEAVLRQGQGSGGTE